MTASSSIHSSAFNFMSFLQGGVDPRTGQYTLAVDIPTLKSHELRGPEWPLRLAYSPLNTQDSGFGTGWNLQLSQFDIASFIVSVHTGETYKVDGRSKAEASKAQGNRWSISEQKLDSFHFHELPKGGEHNRERYRVVHRNGLVEILERMETGSLAFPVEVYSAEGHRLSLAYEKSRRAPEHFRLASIWEGAVTTGTCLFQVVEVNDASGEGVALLYRPDAQGQALARYFMKIASARVTELHLPVGNEAGDPARWRLTYAQKMGLDCISRVMDPRGGVQEITYAETGHEFPRDPRYPPRDPLPRVATHLTRPGHGQPDVEIGYSYPDGGENFLGGGLEIQWDDDGLDNLFKKPGRYRYGSTETLKSSAGERVIVRWFNQFHLLVEQTTTRNGHVHAQYNEYGAKDDVNFKDQVRSCQLPVKNTTSWTLEQQSRTEIVERGYDAFGNLAWEVQNTGVREEYQWYPAAGEPGLCPADPEGFVRHLKDKTVIPAPTAHGSAPTLRYRYRYAAFKPVTGSQQTADWHAQVEETLEDVSDAKKESVLQVTQQAYYDDPATASAVEYGRVKSRTVTLNGLSTRTDYRYHSGPGRHAAAGDEAVLVTEQTVTGHDHAELAPVRKVVTYEHSMYHGEPLLTYDDQDVQIRYSYDAALRVTQETVAPGSEFEASRDYAYALCAYESDQAKQTCTSVMGVVTVTYLDGLGRATRETRNHINDKDLERPYETLRLTHDSAGQVQVETLTDYLPGTLRALPLRTTFSYDDWGNRSAIARPEGAVEHTETNPIGNLDFKGLIKTTWLQAGSTEEPLISNWLESWLNPFEQVVAEHRRDAAGDFLTQTRDYDGLGNCIRRIDERGNETHYAHDAWNRLISTTLPDGTQATRAYQAFSHEELPERVTVIPPPDRSAAPVLLARQDHDGLGRLTQITTAKRTERFEYPTGMRTPSLKMTASGDPIRYSHRAELSDNPTSISSPSEQATFEYDKRHAKLILASSAEGERSFTYDWQNQLASETWQDIDGRCLQKIQSRSLHGRLAIHSTGSPDQLLNTLFTYNDQGLVNGAEITGRLKVECTHDLFGRTSMLLTSDLTSDSTARIDFEYDNQGRESKRILTKSGKPPRTLSQTWGPDGLLTSRQLKQGNTDLLLESFTYDNRSRLESHTFKGSDLPKDIQERRVMSQRFSFDELDNIVSRFSTYEDSAQEIMTFAYLPDDRCQLDSITYHSATRTTRLEINYDDNGCQRVDIRSRTLVYDSQRRLMTVSDGQRVRKYRYDALDQLVAVDDTLIGFEEKRLSVALHGNRAVTLAFLGEQPLAEIANENPPVRLLQTLASHSVIAEYSGALQRNIHYLAHGERSGVDTFESLLGFNGEYRDPITGHYLLGRGHRAYDPEQMRFLQPDALSPFEAGALNGYAYCQGNPVTLRDPSGRFAVYFNDLALSAPGSTIDKSSEQLASERQFWKASSSILIGIGLGVLFTALAVVTAGQALMALPGVAVAATGMMATANAATLATATANATTMVAKAVTFAIVSTVTAISSVVSTTADIITGATGAKWAAKFSEVAGWVNAGTSLGDIATIKLAHKLIQKSAMAANMLATPGFAAHRAANMMMRKSLPNDESAAIRSSTA
ncbi:RHS repeat-associated core domain-containing protein [Pseudomonas sichuanensis]